MIGAAAGIGEGPADRGQRLAEAVPGLCFATVAPKQADQGLARSSVVRRQRQAGKERLGLAGRQTQLGPRRYQVKATEQIELSVYHDLLRRLRHTLLLYDLTITPTVHF